jgi:hypothetical protein
MVSGGALELCTWAMTECRYMRILGSGVFFDKQTSLLNTSEACRYCVSSERFHPGGVKEVYMAHHREPS